MVRMVAMVLAALVSGAALAAGPEVWTTPMKPGRGTVGPAQTIVLCSDRPEHFLGRIAALLAAELPEADYTVIDGRGKTDLQGHVTYAYLVSPEVTEATQACLDRYAGFADFTANALHEAQTVELPTGMPITIVGPPTIWTSRAFEPEYAYVTHHAGFCLAEGCDEDKLVGALFLLEPE